MTLRILIKGQPKRRHVPCPRCQSLDTWRWSRDTSMFRSVAHLLGYTLLTCRGCKHEFYGRKDAPGPVLSLVARLLSASIRPPRQTPPAFGDRPAKRHPSQPRESPEIRVPLGISFDEWKQKQETVN